MFYSRKRFKSKNEIYKSFQCYDVRTNNIARSVLGFKTPDEMIGDFIKSAVKNLNLIKYRILPLIAIK